MLLVREPDGSVREMVNFLSTGARAGMIGGASLPVHTLSLPQAAVRAAPRDPDGDGRTSPGDAVFLVLFLFEGGVPPGCLDSADVDRSGAVDLADAVSLLGFLFLGGPPPAAPGPSPSPCGRGPEAAGPPRKPGVRGLRRVRRPLRAATWCAR